VILATAPSGKRCRRFCRRASCLNGHNGGRGSSMDSIEGRAIQLAFRKKGHSRAGRACIPTDSQDTLRFAEDDGRCAPHFDRKVPSQKCRRLPARIGMSGKAEFSAFSLTMWTFPRSCPDVALASRPFRTASYRPACEVDCGRISVRIL